MPCVLPETCQVINSALTHNWDPGGGEIELLTTNLVLIL